MMKIRYFSVCLIAMLAIQPGVWSQAEVYEQELAQPEANDDLPLIGEIPVEDMVQDRQQLQRQIQQLQQQVQRQNRMSNVLPRSEPSNRRSTASGGFSGGGGFGVESFYGGRTVPDLPAIDWEKDANVQIRVFQMQHAPVEAILPIMQKLFSGKLNISMHPSNRSLIVVGDESGFKLFEDVLRTLDTEPIAPEPIQTADMAVRVYAIENQALSDNDDKVVEEFSMVVTALEELEIENLFTLNDDAFEITRLSRTPNEKTYQLYGVGFEKGAALRLRDKIVQLGGLKITVDQIEAREPSQTMQPSRIEIPQNVQGTLKSLLGNALYVTGYWFGNTSMPGTVEAPLGDWKLVMESADGQDEGFRLDVSVFEQGGGNRPMSGIGIRAPVSFKSSSGTGMMGGMGGGTGVEMNKTTGAAPFTFSSGEKDSLILRNAVTGRIGRPIIIGYNRRDNGQNRLGALVIIPEREFGGGSANQQDAGIFDSIYDQNAK
ncbi:MAG: hypothetical protein P9L94_18900 [Candidatus Hinthialibacter antarcticus]|nr:hypothetical protein [Candidatus Hinthialibacter antarcticus]